MAQVNTDFFSPEKSRNSQILLVLTVFVCYYWTEGEMCGFLTIEYGTVLNF